MKWQRNEPIYPAAPVIVTLTGGFDFVFLPLVRAYVKPKLTIVPKAIAAKDFYSIILI